MSISTATLLNNFRELLITITTYKISDNTEDTVIDGYIIDGSLSIDGQSSVRRTFNATIVLDKNNPPIEEIKNSLSPYLVGGGLEKKIKVEIKVKSEGSSLESQDFGFFILTEVSFSKSVDSYTMSIAAQDLMVLLNGDIGGTIGVEQDFELENTSFNSILTDLMQRHASGVYTGALNISLPKFAEKLGRLTSRLPEDGVYLRQDSEAQQYSSFDSYGRPYSSSGSISITEKIIPSDVGKIYSITVPLTSSTGGVGENLSIAPTDTVSSVIDKIISNIEQNYEYFFTPSGQFNFKLREEFKTIKEPADTDFDNSLFVTGQKYLPSFNTTTPVFDFNNYNGEEIFVTSSYQNSPQVRGIKNEFYVYGKEKILYHLLIGDKPVISDAFLFGRGVKTPSLEYDWHVIRVNSRSVLSNVVTITTDSFAKSPFAVGATIKFNSPTDNTLSTTYSIQSVTANSFTYIRQDSFLPSENSIILIKYNTKNHWQQYIIDIYDLVLSIGKNTIAGLTLNSSIKNKILTDNVKYSKYAEELKAYFMYNGDNSGIFFPTENRLGSPSWRILSEEDNSVSVSLTKNSPNARIFGGKNVQNMLKIGLDLKKDETFWEVKSQDVSRIAPVTISIPQVKILKIVISPDKKKYTFSIAKTSNIASICKGEYATVTYVGGATRTFKVLSTTKTNDIVLENKDSVDLITNTTKILKIEQKYYKCTVSTVDPEISVGQKVYITGKDNVTISTRILEVSSSTKEIRFSDTEKGVPITLPTAPYTIKISSDEASIVQIAETNANGYFQVVLSNRAKRTEVVDLSFNRPLFEVSESSAFKGALTSWNYYFDIICPNTSFEKYKVENIGRRVFSVDKDENITTLFPSFFGDVSQNTPKILIFSDSNSFQSVSASEYTISRRDFSATISSSVSGGETAVVSSGDHGLSVGDRITIWRNGINEYHSVKTVSNTNTFVFNTQDVLSGSFTVSIISVTALLDSEIPESVSSQDLFSISTPNGGNPKKLVGSHRVESVSFSDKKIQFFIRKSITESNNFPIGTTKISKSGKVSILSPTPYYKKQGSKDLKTRNKFSFSTPSSILKQGMFLEITASKSSSTVKRIVQVLSPTYNTKTKIQTFSIKEISQGNSTNFSEYSTFYFSPSFIEGRSSGLLGFYLSGDELQANSKVLTASGNYICLDKSIKKDIVKTSNITYKSFSSEVITNTSDFKEDNQGLFDIKSGFLTAGTPYIAVLESQIGSYFNTDEFKFSNDAFSKIKDMLYRHTNFNETISIESIPIYSLDVNQVVSVTDTDTGIEGNYFINSINIPLSVEGTMSINATKIY